MPKGSIHILGEDEMIIVFGLLGINGTIINSSRDFMRGFEKLINTPSISMVIIAIELSNELIEFIMDFKLNNKRPFIFYLPNIFKSNIERESIFNNKIIESIKRIIF